MRLADLTDQRFGRLLVLRRAPNAGRRTQWLCLCDCGVEKVVAAELLVSGHARSCGCLRSEVVSSAWRTHGDSGTSLYATYRSILDRCYKSTAKNYADYGARGITMCDRWLESYENFAKDMGPRPDGRHPSGHPKYTLDRRDNDGNYEPENCYWATSAQQAANRRVRRRALRPEEIEALADGLMSSGGMTEFRRRIAAIIRQPR